MIIKVFICVILFCFSVACVPEGKQPKSDPLWINYEEEFVGHQIDLQKKSRAIRDNGYEKMLDDLGDLFPVEHRYDNGYERLKALPCEQNAINAFLKRKNKDKLIAQLYEYTTSGGCRNALLSNHLQEVSPVATGYDEFPFVHTLLISDSSVDWRRFVGNADRWNQIFSVYPEVIIGSIMYGRCDNVRYVFGLSGVNEMAVMEKKYPRLREYAESKCGNVFEKK